MGRVVGVGTEKTSHIFDHNKRWVELLNSVEEATPQPGAGAGPDALALTGGADIGARKPTCEHVHGVDARPVGGRHLVLHPVELLRRFDFLPLLVREGQPDAFYVAQVGNVGVAVGEDPGGAGVDLGVPGDGAADHGLHALLEAAVQ
jgi:hypothetical protein